MPFPDARVTWRAGDAAGAWLVELDRATESHAAWRRKLVRYLTYPRGGQVLAVTTTPVRARAIATVAADVGVNLIATTLTVVRQTVDPIVYDGLCRKTRALTAVVAASNT